MTDEIFHMSPTDNIIPLPQKENTEAAAADTARRCMKIYAAFRDVGFSAEQAMDLLHRTLDASWES